MQSRLIVSASLLIAAMPIARAQVLSPDGSFPPIGAKESLNKLIGGISHGTEFTINSLVLDDLDGSAKLHADFSREVVTTGHAHMDITIGGVSQHLDGDFSQDLLVDYLSTDSDGTETYNLLVRKF